MNLMLVSLLIIPLIFTISGEVILEDLIPERCLTYESSVNCGKHEPNWTFHIVQGFPTCTGQSEYHCSASPNNFFTLEECLSTCVGHFPEICITYPKRHEFSAPPYVKRPYYYSLPDTNNPGGCQMHENPGFALSPNDFETEEECRAACIDPLTTTTTTPTPSDGGGDCFPSASEVKLKTGKSVTMSELQIGDQVQTVSSTGSVTYSEVRAFLKKWPKKMTQYKSITTANETITLTGNHLVYTRKNIVDPFNPIYANYLSVGHEVLIQGNSEMTPEKITNVSNLNMQGAYVPLLAEGRIMVDGVLASCYADFDHDLAHLTMIPMQKIPALMKWIFGEGTGYSVYVSSLRNLGMMLLPEQHFWSQ